MASRSSERAAAREADPEQPEDAELGLDEGDALFGEAQPLGGRPQALKLLGAQQQVEDAVEEHVAHLGAARGVAEDRHVLHRPRKLRRPLAAQSAALLLDRRQRRAVRREPRRDGRDEAEQAVDRARRPPRAAATRAPAIASLRLTEARSAARESRVPHARRGRRAAAAPGEATSVALRDGTASDDTASQTAAIG